MWIEIDFVNRKPPRIPPTVHHNIHKIRQQRTNISVRQMFAGIVLLDHQPQRVKRPLRAARVAGCDRSRMTSGDRAYKRKCSSVAQLLHQHPIRPHPQRSLDQILRTNPRQSLIALRVKQRHQIALRQSNKFRSVLDGDQPLLKRDRLDQRFRNVVLPDPVSPVAMIVFFARTAAGKNSSQRRAACSAVNSRSAGWERSRAPTVRANNPPAASVAILGLNVDGRRIVRLIVPAGTAGGRQICTRCPSGRIVPHSGFAGPTSCCDIDALSVTIASRARYVISGTSNHSQPARVSIPISPGRLITSSVASSRERYPEIGASSARSVRSPSLLIWYRPSRPSLRCSEEPIPHPRKALSEAPCKPAGNQGPAPPECSPAHLDAF